MPGRRRIHPEGVDPADHTPGGNSGSRRLLHPVSGGRPPGEEEELPLCPDRGLRRLQGLPGGGFLCPTGGHPGSPLCQATSCPVRPRTWTRMEKLPLPACLLPQLTPLPSPFINPLPPLPPPPPLPSFFALGLALGGRAAMGKAGNDVYAIREQRWLAALFPVPGNQRERQVQAGRQACPAPPAGESMEAARSNPTTPGATCPTLGPGDDCGRNQTAKTSCGSPHHPRPGAGAAWRCSEWDAARLKLAPCRYSGSPRPESR